MKHHFVRDQHDRWAFDVRLGGVRLRTLRYMVPVEKLNSPRGGLRNWRFDVHLGNFSLQVAWR